MKTNEAKLIKPRVGHIVFEKSAQRMCVVIAIDVPNKLFSLQDYFDAYCEYRASFSLCTSVKVNRR